MAREVEQSDPDVNIEDTGQAVSVLICSSVGRPIDGCRPYGNRHRGLGCGHIDAGSVFGKGSIGELPLDGT